MFNAINPELVAEFSLNATQIGNLAACYNYTVVLCLLGVGMLLDRFSTRYLILSAMAGCVLSTFLFSQAHSLFIAEVCRLGSGITGAFVLLCCIVLASRWFPANKLARVTSVIVTMAMLGGTLAQGPLTYLVSAIGWRHAMLWNGVLGLLFLAIMFYCVEDHPEHKVLKHQPNDTQHSPSLAGLKHALSNIQNWLCGSYTCLMNLLIAILGAVWGGIYLVKVHHMTRVQASDITTMIFVGTILGSLVFGWVSDIMGRRKLPMVIGAILSLGLSLLLVTTTSLSFLTLMALFLAMGFFTSTQIITYPTIFESNPPEMTGVCESLSSTLIMSGGAIFQPLFGWMMDRHWSGTLANGLREYSTQDYQFAYWILPAAFLVSLALALCVRETYCQPYCASTCPTPDTQVPPSQESAVTQSA